MGGYRRITILMFSEDLRLWISYIIILAFAALLICDGMMIRFVYIMSFDTPVFMHFIDDKVSQRLFRNAQALLTINGSFHVVGFLLFVIMLNPRMRNMCSNTQEIYVMYLYIPITIYLFSVIIILFGHTVKLENNFGVKFYNSLLSYNRDPMITMWINQVQIKYSCCGSKNFSDWKVIKWADKKYTNAGVVAMDITMLPFSCCRIKYTKGPCITEYDNRMSVSHSNVINLEPCNTSLSKSYTFYIIENFNDVLFIMGCIQVLLLYPVRMIQTSMRRALKKGYPLRKAYGYLYRSLPKMDTEEKMERHRKAQENVLYGVTTGVEDYENQAARFATDPFKRGSSESSHSITSSSQDSMNLIMGAKIDVFTQKPKYPDTSVKLANQSNFKKLFNKDGTAMERKANDSKTVTAMKDFVDTYYNIEKMARQDQEYKSLIKGRLTSEKKKNLLVKQALRDIDDH